ncbi:MAG: hypothetical protein RMK18_08070 [Armatimonadota bacterium]|nr:hypothetical protein [Armatimonadota bacterium]MCX7776727.1 hypothetical protein [Armatimonadota bacterium]MDW8025796.1 hypothetical protein [Armatimonadota bacterium]
MPIFQYLLLLKQVQAVLMFNPKVGVTRDALAWLQHRPRANTIGVPPALFNSSNAFQLPPFTKLVYPHGNVARFYAELSPDIPDYIREPIVLGSCYAVPVLLLEPSLFREVKSALLWEKRGQPFSQSELSSFLSPIALTIPEFIEIAEETLYALRDFVQSLTSEEEIMELVERRGEVARTHAERKFGSSISSDMPVIMACVDPLRLILPWLLKGRRDVLVKLPWNDLIATGLGIVWMLIVHPEARRKERMQRYRNVRQRQA